MVKHVSEFLSKLVSEDNSWKVKLLSNWSEIIGNLSDKVSIEKIERDLLVLNVSNPAWAQELFMLSHVLKKKINDFLGNKYINQIRFKTIRRNYKNNKNFFTQKEFNDYSRGELKDIFLTPEEKKELSKILDDELKEHMENFYLCCKRGRSKRCLNKKKKE